MSPRLIRDIAFAASILPLSLPLSLALGSARIAIQAK